MATDTYIEFTSKQVNPNIPDVFDVLPQETFERKDSIYLIDVRRPDEWVGEYGHIETAKLLTLDTLPTHIHSLPKDKTIVFICRSGARSAQATQFAQENGYQSVYNMKGGMIEWQKLNLPAIERNGE